MESKKCKAVATRDPAMLTVNARSESEQEAAIARASIAPQYQAALTARAYTPLPKEQVHGDALVAELIAQCAAAAGGDLSRGETMLVAQAHALDAIFGECARRARSNMGEYPQTADMYLRQALVSLRALVAFVVGSGARLRCQSDDGSG